MRKSFFLVYFISICLTVLCQTEAQTTTTPTPARGQDPCRFAVWNDTLTFSGILAGTIIGGLLLGIAIGFGVGEAQNKGWEFKFPWSQSRLEQDYLYRPVIIAPISR